jgi:hypothetical protein
LFHATCPWGFVTASRAFPSRPAVTPLDARCPRAVLADELSFAGERLQGVAPTESPFSGTRGWARSRADALLTFSLSEVRSFGRWAEALPSRACSPEMLSGLSHCASRGRGATGCRSDRTWKPLRRLASTSMRFPTSSDPRLSSNEREQARSHRPEAPSASAARFSGSKGVTRCDHRPYTEVKLPIITRGD